MRDIYAYLDNIPEYIIDGENSKVVDQNGYVTGHILRVHRTGENKDIPVKDRDKLFTIYLYKTSSTSMINGPEYKYFVDNDLPKLFLNLDSVEDLLNEANANMKVGIISAVSKLKQDGKKQCG